MLTAAPKIVMLSPVIRLSVPPYCGLSEDTDVVGGAVLVLGAVVVALLVV